MNAQGVLKVDELFVEWQLIENNYQDKAQFLAAFKIMNKSKRNLNLKGASLYFSYPRGVTSVVSKNASFENGR